jgi:hypothetical protein
MFERYTEKARRTIFFARFEASAFGSPKIETEHILLGLLREDKILFHHLLPKISYETIREKLTAQAQITSKKKVPTTVDLPLDNASKQVLKFAAEEADRLNHIHIGTEHLLLGLLREEKSPGATLLQEHGAKLPDLRKGVEKLPDREESPVRRYAIQARGYHGDLDRTIEIHGSAWNIGYVNDTVQKYRAPNWHWRKSPWTSRDIVVERKSGKITFDLTLGENSTEFEIVKGGWKKDHCVICYWELTNSEDQEHSNGYTNGRDWLCMECYEKFWQRPDFISSSYSDIT